MRTLRLVLVATAAALVLRMMNVSTTLCVPQQQQSTTRLAYRHSRGLMDVPDADWKAFYQRPAREAQHYKYPEDRDRDSDTAHRWIFFNWDPYLSCPHLRKVGGLGGGGKWTCNVESLQKADCLVYSIGSKGNYKFEDDLHELTGCEIHVFDPGEYHRAPTSGTNIHYHQWGLGSSYSIEWMARRKNGIYLSFPEIRRRLGHEGRTIDIFKIDCESCEWHSYLDWVGADLRQILIETHDLPSPVREKRTDFGIFPLLSPSTFFDTLQQHGYVLFSKEVNTHNGRGRSAEWSFLKLQPEFFVETT